MTQYWIFVSVPFSDFNRGTIFDMIEKIKMSRRWPIGKKTFHKKELSKGDRILFYQAGEEGKKFVGSGELFSNLHVDEENILDFVAVGNIKLWQRHIPIRELLDSLSFIKDKKHWGLYLQGGVIKISEGDYNTILKEAQYKCSYVS